MVRMFSKDRAWVGRAVRAFRNPGRVLLWNHQFYHVLNWQLLSFKGNEAEWLVCLEPVARKA